MIAKNCTAHMNSMVQNEYTNEKRPVIAFKNCNLVHGNSGSPMLGSNGKIKALAQSALAGKKDEGGSSADFLTKAMRLLYRGRFALGTNMACVENPELALTAGTETCDFSKTTVDYGAQVKTMLNEIDLTKLLEKMQTESDSRYEEFKFTAKLLAEDQKNTTDVDSIMSVTAEPTCIVGSTTNIPWLKKYQNSGLHSLLNKYPESAIVTITIDTIRFVMDLDENLRAGLKRENRSLPVHLKLPLREIAKHPERTFDITGPTSTKIYRLKLCGLPK